MASVAPAGAADRIAARTLFKVLRAGSGTRARYSSTFFGATLPFAARPRSLEFAFLICAIPRGHWLSPSLRLPRGRVTSKPPVAENEVAQLRVPAMSRNLSEKSQNPHSQAAVAGFK